MIFVRAFIFVIGVIVVVLTINSAIRTFVLPRSAADKLSRVVFSNIRKLFNLRTRIARSYNERDAVMALYAPVGLLVMLITWLACIAAGYTCMFWAMGVRSETFGPWTIAFMTSGSSLLTLGIAPLSTLPVALVGFSEAAVGLIMVALLISYLPTMYSAFSQREAAVTLLDVRAGSPPSAVEMIKQYHRLRRLDLLDELWLSWEVWFAYIEESHTSLAALSFFRSPQPDHSWVTAAGTILDTASLAVAVLDTPHNPQADLCIRAGYLALQRIAAYFKLPQTQLASSHTAPSISRISVTRGEFDAAYDELARAGVPLKPDREQTWHDFAGWRVNYDTPLLLLARLMMAPEAPWTSDRLPVDSEKA